MYEKSKFQEARSVPYVPKSIMPNGYINKQDSIKDMRTPGYFPDYFGFEEGIVLPEDKLVVDASDGPMMLGIVSVKPVVLKYPDSLDGE